MPLKQYACMECEDQQIERTERINSQELPPFCPKCGNRMVWAPTAMNFALKGGGWTPKGKQ